ncbi:MAG TPA: hypothetical protein VGC54_08645 [Planctomycetota bacterium]
MTRLQRHKFALKVCIALSLAACASVSPEALTLSQKVGEDLGELQSGYRETVRFSFTQMRNAGLNVIDNVWTPAFLAGAVKKGKLVEFAADPDDGPALVEFWARKTIGEIDRKRRTFLDSVQAKEDALLIQIDEAFDRVLSANAAVSAHLNSLLEVQSLQDQALAAAGVPGLRGSIHAKIVEASDFVATTTTTLQDEAKVLRPDPSE